MGKTRSRKALASVKVESNSHAPNEVKAKLAKAADSQRIKGLSARKSTGSNSRKTNKKARKCSESGSELGAVKSEVESVATDEAEQSNAASEGSAVILVDGAEAEPKGRRKPKPKATKAANRVSTNGKSEVKEAVKQQKLLTSWLQPKSEPGDVEQKKKFDSDIPFEGRARRANMFVGGHLSISGGLENAAHEALQIGARAFAMFLGSQRTWKQAQLTEAAALRFREAVTNNGLRFEHIVPHSSYLLNCGSPNDEAYERSREALLDSVKRCEELGIRLFNLHPGSTCGQHYPEERSGDTQPTLDGTISPKKGDAQQSSPSKKRKSKGGAVKNTEAQVEACLRRIAACTNYVLSKTKDVTILFETMCGQGNTVGGSFSELRQLVDMVDDRDRVGVTIDTCHMFAFGHDLRTAVGYEKCMRELEDTLGWRYVKAVHVNDSEGECGSHLDRHAKIGHGRIGIGAFRRLMNDPRFENIPLVLETPEESYEREVKLLYSLVEKD